MGWESGVSATDILAKLCILSMTAAAVLSGDRRAGGDPDPGQWHTGHNPSQDTESHDCSSLELPRAQPPPVHVNGTSRNFTVTPAFLFLVENANKLSQLRTYQETMQRGV